MEEYTEGFKGKVSKMGDKRLINIPRDKFKEFRRGCWVRVTKLLEEK